MQQSEVKILTGSPWGPLSPVLPGIPGLPWKHTVIHLCNYRKKLLPTHPPYHLHLRRNYQYDVWVKPHTAVLANADTMDSARAGRSAVSDLLILLPS